MSSSVIAVKIKDRPRVAINQSNLVARGIDSLVDVDTSEKINGSLLIYDETDEKFKASTLLERQTLNGGNF